MMTGKRQFAEKLLPITIAGLGLAAAFGTQSYLEGYLRVSGWTDWANLPSILAAASIEAAYVVLATLRPDNLIREQIMTTAKALVWASVLFNLGHAYDVAVPGGLSVEKARFEWLAFLQALAVAAFVPWIAYRLAAVAGAISAQHEVEDDSSDKLRADLEASQREVAEQRRAAAVYSDAVRTANMARDEALANLRARITDEVKLRQLDTLPPQPAPGAPLLPPPPHMMRPPPTIDPDREANMSMNNGVPTVYPSLAGDTPSEGTDGAVEVTRIGPAPAGFDPTAKHRETR